MRRTFHDGPLNAGFRSVLRSLANRHTLTALAILAIACGCTTPPRNPEAANGWTDVPVRFITSSGDETPRRERPYVWLNMLGIIPGEIFGVPHYSLQTEEMHVYDVPIARFNFFALQTELARQATTMTAAALAEGLRIQPTDTRFARVATTIGVSAMSGPRSVGFRDELRSKYVLVLVYFDRPCGVSGTLIAANGKTWSVNLTIEKAGLTWLRMGNGNVTTVATPSDIMFVIQSSGN